MCGICGYVDKAGGAGVEGGADRKLLERMCQLMVHRGPDDQGLYTADGCGLGMRRLSIIDLGTGHQPILNEDGAIAIVCNGEIYNFVELRDDLRGKGHVFLTGSDSEVALHLYEEYGADMVKRLSGMFALAIWDDKQKVLLLARDRLGIKPLYYMDSGRRLVFASELKCLLECSEMSSDINPAALHNYLSLNYVPGPATIFAQARKLQPGHYMLCKGGRVDTFQYWDMQFSLSGEAVRSEDSYAEELLEILQRSVKRHMISDVPLGVMCSGGIDSSTVVALASKLQAGPIKTFSIGFEESSFNELAHARCISERFHTEHHEEVLRPDAAALLPLMAWHMDEPFADHSVIPTYCVAKLARQNATVALTGDGADELLAGYETYEAHQYRSLLSRLPRGVVKGLLAPAVNMLPVSDTKVSFDYRARRLLRGYDLPAAEAHLSWKEIFSEAQKKELYSSDYREAHGGSPTSELYNAYFDSAPAVHELDKILYIDSKVYLADDILMKVDKTSMAVSLESRVPFLDPEVVEFVSRLPPHMKLKGLVKKYILKRSLLDILPKKILDRRKAGFSMPIARWIKTDLREMVRDLLAPSAIRAAGFFNPEFVQKLIGEHMENRRDNSRPIWSLVNFMLWHDAFKGSTRRGGGL